jgi:hypothetical protein
MGNLILIKDLIDNCNKALEALAGKTPTKEPGGLSQMTKEILEPVLKDMDGALKIDSCRIKVYCSPLDKEIEFADIKPTYKADRRTWNGVGEKLECLKVVLTRDIPEDLSVVDLSQQLSYDYAKENFDRLKREQDELREQFAANLKAMEELQDVMRCEAYNDDKSREAEQAKYILYELRK